MVRGVRARSALTCRAKGLGPGFRVDCQGFGVRLPSNYSEGASGLSRTQGFQARGPHPREGV